MEISSKSKQNHIHSCCQSKEQLCELQLSHLMSIITQRYISPYKIMYMINQQEADFFKLRNKGSGCCSSSLITIPKDQMTKTQLFLQQTIKQSLKINNLNKILEQLSDKYHNIVKSGQKQNLKVDEQVEKFLLEKTLSQGFNSHIYKSVIQKLKQQTSSISNSAMLWATPNTWYAKYPNTPLNFLSSQTLSDLNNSKKGYGFETNFLGDYKDNLLKQLRLLEQDGRFQQQIWVNEHLSIRNDTKVLNFPQKYCFDGSQESYKLGQITYPNLKKSLLSLRSIPFELNAKLNVYCTISQNNQISYFKNTLIYKVKEKQSIFRYSTFCFIGQGKIRCFIKSKKQSLHQKIKQKIFANGDFILIDNQLCQVQLQGQGDNLFLFRSWISTLAKKN